jgi:hypothetical protein
MFNIDICVLMLLYRCPHTTICVLRALERADAASADAWLTSALPSIVKVSVCVCVCVCVVCVRSCVRVHA